MEPGVRTFLLRIVNTISLGLLWLVINSTVGIMHGWAFPEKTFRWGNGLFYFWLLSSGIFLFWWLRKTWKKPIDFDAFD